MRPPDWSPLTDTDPVPGEPAEAARLARRYADTAREIDAQAAVLARFGQDDSGAWDSDAGRVFAEHAGDLSGDVAKAQHRYTVASAALAEWSQLLEETQAEADSALAAAKEAQARAAAHAPLPSGGYSPTILPGSPESADARRRALALDEAESDLARARRRLALAVDSYTAAASRLGAQIRDASGHDGLKDSRWDRFKGWVCDRASVFRFVAEVAGAIALVASVLSLVLGWVPILGQVLIAVALIATAVSLIANTMLAMAGEGSWLLVGLDVVALASFGAAGLITRPLARSAAPATSRVAVVAGTKTAQLADDAIVRGVATERNAANFYSGRGARAAAERAADDLGHATTLERTPGGKWLDEQRLFEGGKVSPAEADQAWRATSEQFAREASGDVRAYINNPGPNSVFNSVELPTLRDGLATGRITSITIHDISTGASKVERFVPSPGRSAASDAAVTVGLVAQEGRGP